MYGNIGFMGLPLIQAVLGEEGMVFAIVGQVAFTLFAWSHGVLLMGGKEGFSVKKLRSLQVFKRIKAKIQHGAGIRIVLGIPVLQHHRHKPPVPFLRHGHKGISRAAGEAGLSRHHTAVGICRSAALHLMAQGHRQAVGPFLGGADGVAVHGFNGQEGLVFHAGPGDERHIIGRGVVV